MTEQELEWTRVPRPEGGFETKQRMPLDLRTIRPGYARTEEQFAIVRRTTDGKAHVIYQGYRSLGRARVQLEKVAQWAKNRDADLFIVQHHVNIAYGPWENVE